MSIPQNQLANSTLPAYPAPDFNGKQASKSALLMDLMRKPDTYDKIDCGWRLVMWLMMTQSGVTIRSYEELADQLGSISKSSVKKWADGLVEKGIMDRKQKGNRVELRLTGEFMKIANAPDTAHSPAPSPDATDTDYTDNPDMSALMKLAEGTEQLGGQVVITIQGCQFSHLGKKK